MLAPPPLEPNPRRYLPLTVIIPTLNEEDRLPGCLASVTGWAAEVIVADKGSSDGTVPLAKRAGATVLENTGPTIGAQRNQAIAHAGHEWVLAVDADERVSPELMRSIAAALEKPAHDAYQVRMRNVYLGRPILRGEWANDWHVRLFKKSLRFREHRVHEALDVTGPVGTLGGTLEHAPYRNFAHHVEKLDTYATWGAQDLFEQGKRASAADLALRPWWRFVKSYVLEGLWLDGRLGLVMSAMSAYAGFLKYARLWALEHERAGGSRAL